MIDNAMVTVADLVADNGVVHVINAVLIPESTNIIENNISINDNVVKKYDIYGRELKNTNHNSISIEIYQSGKTIKKLIIK